MKLRKRLWGSWIIDGYYPSPRDPDHSMVLQLVDSNDGESRAHEMTCKEWRELYPTLPTVSFILDTRGGK